MILLFSVLDSELPFCKNYFREIFFDQGSGETPFLPVPQINLLLLLLYKFIYLFLAALGLHCYARAFSSCGQRGATPHCGVRASHCGGFSCCGAQALGTWASVVVACRLQSTGSVVVAHRLSCSTACGIFLEQGSNPCHLHWQADSQPLRHQGSPVYYYYFFLCNERVTLAEGHVVGYLKDFFF